MPTNVFLVRSGETTWSAQGRINGRRDLGLTAEGRQQAQQALAYLAGIQLDEILSSPLSRAVQTAEIFGASFNLGIGRDPRLIEVGLGSWEGSRWETLVSTEAYQDILAAETCIIPEGEDLRQASQRAISSVEQTVADNPRRSNILITAHACILRLILVHYLGAPPGCFLNLKLVHGALSLLRFFPEHLPPQVLGINIGGVPFSGLDAAASE